MSERVGKVMQDEPEVTGLDIGGANLKAASTMGASVSCSFPLWSKPDQLAIAIKGLLQRLPNDSEIQTSKLAVTMTGELADCFRNRAEGVRTIVRKVLVALQGTRWDSAEFYGVDGHFHSSEWAIEHTDVIAAANWHALGNYVAGEFAADGWLIDVGSTTCDVLQLAGGTVNTPSKTDHDRLRSGELVYLGCRRTPVCALVDQLPVSGQTTFHATDQPAMVPVMREVFATTDDVGLVLGHVNERASDLDTADGKPRTVSAAINRLARMVGLDHRNFGLADAQLIAANVLEQAGAKLLDAARRLHEIGPPKTDGDFTLIYSGHGSWMVPSSFPSALLNDKDFRSVSLEEELGSELSRCAPAYAVAKLCAKHAFHC